MSTEGWGNNAEGQFNSRNFSNSNYRGQRREGGGGNGGYQGFRPNYNAGGTGGFGAPRTGGGYGGQNGGGRQYYGGQERAPRQNFGSGQPRVGGGGGGGFNNYQQSGASSKIDIESNKVGMVIGRGGGKIREIQDNFNVHVRIGMLLVITSYYMLLLITSLMNHITDAHKY